MKRLPLEVRFWLKVDMSAGLDGCWPWLGGKLGGRYGAIKVKGKWVLAHRLMHELMIGPIPPNHEVDHLCRRTDCVNFTHLEAVTPNENKLRAGTNRRLSRTHCKRGHLLTEDNSYVHAKRPLYKQCKICRHMHKAALSARRAQRGSA